MGREKNLCTTAQFYYKYRGKKNKNGKKDCAFVHSIAFQRLLVHIMTFGSTTQYWGLMFMQMASCEATMQAYKTKENS